MGNWFRFTPDRIHEDDKSTQEKLETLDRFAPIILKFASIIWITFLICTFSLIVCVRAALSIPLF